MSVLEDKGTGARIGTEEEWNANLLYQPIPAAAPSLDVRDI